ncbi:MAG: PP2C family protein-serine/threonine phosphatase [Acidobacteriaceae bacterium]|nr:PP2C family protein-serine/threonine phosphatase [Acidobacteriaceae bacterium]MBV9778789.1 PP2C family protein-serine/threonine phosphatase [Acidobacteriaceae bacterium]
MGPQDIGRLAQVRLQSLLVENIFLLSLGFLILFSGLAGLALWIVRRRSNERILLWFGLNALIYGLRALVKNPLIRVTFGVSQYWRDYFVAWGDFLIVIPATLLLEEVFGRGWRSSVRWGVWILAGYAFIGLMVGVLSGNPYRLPEPARILLLPLLLFIFLLNVSKGYRPPQFADAKIFLIGLGIFIAFIFEDHWAPPRFQAEPIGFFTYTCTLGIIAVRRAIRNERRLLAVEQEMASARQIQSSILPAEAPQIAGVRIAARYSPMATVAGDFYDFAPVDSNRLGILVADVAGHGMPAALIASMVKVALASQQPHAGDPSLVISGLNEVFCNQLRSKYLTAGYLVIDACHRAATYSGAGHPPLIVWRASEQNVERYENNGLFLGFRANETYPKLDIPLSPGDRLLLYTDGLLEATNHAEQCFGDGIDSCIARHHNLSADQFADALLADLRAWSGNSNARRQDDDLTLLVIDFCHGESTVSQSPHSM